MNNKICKNLTKILIILIIASFLGTQGQIVYGMSFGGGEFPPAPSGGGGGGGGSHLPLQLQLTQMHLIVINLLSAHT